MLVLVAGVASQVPLVVEVELELGMAAGLDAPASRSGLRVLTQRPFFGLRSLSPFALGSLSLAFRFPTSTAVVRVIQVKSKWRRSSTSTSTTGDATGGATGGATGSATGGATGSTMGDAKGGATRTHICQQSLKSDFCLLRINATDLRF